MYGWWPSQVKNKVRRTARVHTKPAEQEPLAEAKPKKQRKPRTKKAESVIVPISNDVQPELIAFQ
jgi:hypothetical protein